MRALLILSLLCVGCTEYQECLYCKSPSHTLKTCESDVLGWDYELLTENYTTHGYDTCVFEYEERIVWGYGN